MCDSNLCICFQKSALCSLSERPENSRSFLLCDLERTWAVCAYWATLFIRWIFSVITPAITPTHASLKLLLSKKILRNGWTWPFRKVRRNKARVLDTGLFFGQSSNQYKNFRICQSVNPWINSNNFLPQNFFNH